MPADYQIYVSESLTDSDWDAFVAQTTGGHHVQTSCWARVKFTLGWKAFRVLVKDQERIVAGAQLLVLPIPLAGSIGYVTKGPLISGENPELAVFVLQSIKQLARQHRCQLLAIQPPNNCYYLTHVLESLSFNISPIELAPTASVVIELEHGPHLVMERMKRETRRNIGRSERAGIVVREGGVTDLDTFYQLYLASAHRQRFLPYKRNYFDELWKHMAPQGWVALLLACYGNETVSAQLLITFGDTVTAKMVGWAGEHAKRYPNDALLWASVEWALHHGYKYFDFEGLDMQKTLARLNGTAAPTSGPDIFKCGFGGKMVLYPSTYDYLPNKMLGWLHHRMPCFIGNEKAGRIVELLRKC